MASDPDLDTRRDSNSCQCHCSRTSCDRLTDRCVCSSVSVTSTVSSSLLRSFLCLLTLLVLLMCADASSRYSSYGREGYYDGYYQDDVRFGKLRRDPCYHATGKAQFCQPQFLNLALGKQVKASSTCDPNSSNCGQGGSVKARPSPLCPGCQYDQPKPEYRAEYLTDHYPYRKTCWASDAPKSTNTTHVNLTLNFSKKNIVYYMSLMDCGQPLPDNLEVLKSVDYGKNWQRWHLFSKNCERDFGVTGMPYQFKQRINSRQVICTNIRDMVRDEYGSGGTISFSTNFNRAKSSRDYESDPLIVDWMTATDIKIVLKRNSDNKDVDKPFAFSNIDVGGRCFCNGHSSRCVQRNGRMVCECAHGTEGDDCERCRAFWVDLPWVRGTALRPSECKRCNCNLHSSICHFNSTLYSLSPIGGGGVCRSCAHNTDGRFCHYCRPGFYRNWALPVSHRLVCNLCNCHPLGSRTNICDRTSGKCVCKNGVEGPKCDRCRAGYTQTHNTREPCRKKGFREETILPQKQKQKSKPRRRKCGGKCKSSDRRLTQVDYCIRQWSLIVRVTGRQRHRRWVKVMAQIKGFFKCRNCLHVPNTLTFWIKRRNWRCKCPRMRRGRVYLVVTRDKRHRRMKTDLILDKRSIVWEWKEGLRAKLQRYENFMGYYKDGCQDCDCIVKKERRRRERRRKQRRRGRARGRSSHTGGKNRAGSSQYYADSSTYSKTNGYGYGRGGGVGVRGHSYYRDYTYQRNNGRNRRNRRRGRGRRRES